VQTSARGASGTQVVDQKRVVKAIPVPHIQLNAHIEADEVAGVREFGTTNTMQTVESVVARKLMLGGNNLDITEEHLAMGALQGIVLDADGSTITDLYTDFGVVKEATTTFHITTSNAVATGLGDGKLLLACHAIVRTIRKNLRMGGLLPRIWCFASPGFMDAFTTSNEVRTNFQRFREVASIGEVGAFLREGAFFGTPPFYYGGIWFEEYRGGFVDDNHAAFFPILPPGSPSLYQWYYAPADYIETVNTLGRPRYAKVAIDPVYQKWVDIEMQTNPLPVCLRPTALMDGTFD
jgi:hypothetical protein